MAKREKNAEKSKLDILEAAESQFAEKGFYGARIDEIAKLAQINKRMIYEYFVNKENLYKQVLFRVYSRMEAVEYALLCENQSGAALIRSIIAAYFAFLRANPSFVNILMWENLNKASYLNELPPEQVHRKTIRIFKEKILEGIRTGEFRPTVDAEQTVLSLIVVCFANFSNRYTLSTLFEQDLREEEILEIRKKHTIDIVLSYLCQ